MREVIEKRLDTIRKRVDSRGQSDGTVIATHEEMCWFAEQAARDGILLSFKTDPAVYNHGDDCYYHYWAMTAYYEKEELKQFVDRSPLLPVSALNKLLPPADTTDPDEQRVAENIKKIRRLIQARDRRRRKCKRDEEQRQAELKLSQIIAADREEAADHRNNLVWLVERIESMGWNVTLRRKSNNGPKKD